jgi:Leucine-rich repeat (LRR) protein
MKILLKAIRSSEDLTCLFYYCENNGIEILRQGWPMNLDNIQTGVINWGGYGSSFGFGPNLFNYFKLKYPDGDPPRGKAFARVKMIFNGELANSDTEEVIQRIEKLGGLVVQDIDEKVNLIVNGKGADKQLVKKAEELSHILVLDEERFIEILPAVRKKPIKRKVNPRKDIPDTVDKKLLDKLKKFFISRDNDLISQGLEMYRSLQNADVANYFLDGVQYSSKGGGHLIPNPVFSGTGPAQPYLNYVLLGVISYAPDDCEIANNLKSSVVSLDIELSNSSTLEGFINLESLILKDSDSLLIEIDGLSSLNKLKHFEINSEGFYGNGSLQNNLKSLKSLLNKSLDMTSLDLSNFRALEDLEGLQSMTKLKTLDISDCGSLRNVDALKGLANLEEVKFDSLYSLESLENLNYTGTELSLWLWNALKNLDGVQNMHQLESISIGCENISDITALKGMKSLKKIEISSSDNLLSLSGIESLPSLEELHIDSEVINSFSGLKDLKSLDKVHIQCDRLNNLKGLEEAPNITDLNLTSKGLEDISNIKSLTKLKDLDLSECSSIESLSGLEKLNLLKSLKVTDCSKLKSLDGAPNSDVFVLGKRWGTGVEVDLSACSSLEDITALKGASKIDWFEMTGCSSIKTTEGLEKIEIDYLSCSGLDISLLQKLNNLDVKTLSLSEEMTSFEGLKKWESVTTLYFSSNLKTLIGINAFPNIKFLYLGSEHSNSNDRLENLTGVEELKHLEKLDLTGCATVKDVNSLSELPNLAELRMDGCINVNPLPRPKVMENREKVEKYQLRLLKALGKDIPVTAKKKSTESKSDKSSVDKKTFSKIKKLLTARDINLIDQGVELVRSLEDHSLYQKLLEGGIEYKTSKTRYMYDSEEEVDGFLIPNPTFTGTGPAQPYLDYAMRSLLNNAPNDFVQEIRNEVKELRIEAFADISNFTNLEELYLSRSWNSPEGGKRTISSLKELSVFEKLTLLHIYEYDYFIQNDDQDLKGLTNLKQLRNLHLSGEEISLKKLVGIENCTKLQHLIINGCTHLIDVEGLNGCQELESIELSYATNLKNLDGLQGCNSLMKINISASESLKNLDGLKGLTALETINISDSESLENLDGLRGLKELSNVYLSNLNSLKNVDGLEGCSALEALSIESDSLENIDGLQNLKALNSINLNAVKLKNVDGLAGCENLEDCNINSDVLENLNGLKGLNKIKELEIPSSSKLINLDGLAGMDGLRRINLYSNNFEFTQKIPPIRGVNIKSATKTLESIGNLINLTHIVIKDCTELENLNGLEAAKNLKSVIIQDCKLLKDVDALLSLPKLEIFKIRSCGIKKGELLGHLKVIVETTISYEDDLPHEFDDNS